MITANRALDLLRGKRTALKERTKSQVEEICASIDEDIQKAIDAAALLDADRPAAITCEYEKVGPDANFIYTKVIEELRKAGWSVHITTDSDLKVIFSCAVP